MAERRDLAPDEDLEPVLAANETVFVQFHADWCAPCAVLSEFFTEVEEDLQGG